MILTRNHTTATTSTAPSHPTAPRPPEPLHDRTAHRD